jgi:hypothetical protein
MFQSKLPWKIFWPKTHESWHSFERLSVTSVSEVSVVYVGNGQLENTNMIDSIVKTRSNNDGQKKLLTRIWGMPSLTFCSVWNVSRAGRNILNAVVGIGGEVRPGGDKECGDWRVTEGER